MRISKNTNLLNEIDISWCIVQMLFLVMWLDLMKIAKRYKNEEIPHGYNRLQNNAKLEKALSMSKGKRCRISFIFDMTLLVQWKWYLVENKVTFDVIRIEHHAFIEAINTGRMLIT